MYASKQWPVNKLVKIHNSHLTWLHEYAFEESLIYKTWFKMCALSSITWYVAFHYSLTNYY